MSAFLLALQTVIQNTMLMKAQSKAEESSFNIWKA